MRTDILARMFLVLSIFIYSTGGIAAVPPNIQQATFDDPEDAVDSLEEALESSLDEPPSDQELLNIFGPASKDLLNTGDPVADRMALNHFAEQFNDQVEIVKIDNYKSANKNLEVAILLVGKQEWPFPIALVKEEKGWRFDTEVGRQEIINRRIGENELLTLAFFAEFHDAQREYFEMKGESGEYATRFFSSPGKRDGLYWEPVEGEPLSPMGPLVAQAALDGYKTVNVTEKQPFQGYYFKILTKQGKNARGGAMDYVANGKMTRGYALLAYPANWDVTGVKTFIVGPDGVVYEKNLGPKTAEVAAKINQFDPDFSWDPA